MTDFVWVPREPTEAMLDAAQPAPAHWDLDGPDGPAMRAAITADRLVAAQTYRAMLSVAPQTSIAEAVREAGEALRKGYRAAIHMIEAWATGFYAYSSYGLGDGSA